MGNHPVSRISAAELAEILVFNILYLKNVSVPLSNHLQYVSFQETGVTCVWQENDFMVGRRAYGAIDAKVF